MRWIKKILRWLIYLIMVPIAYGIIALILTTITISREDQLEAQNSVIYLSTNGVHLDIIIPKVSLDSTILSGLRHHENDQFFAFGWGDENFYINTPTWNDLTFSNAMGALFLNSSTLMHVTRHQNSKTDWTAIDISLSELKKLTLYLQSSFKTEANGDKIWLPNQGYGNNDDFYRANGNYSCLNTCNSWVNSGFKTSGLKACLWTPFDFGLLNKYVP